MQTSIQIVTINNTRCKSEKFIGITDIYGNFDITIPNDPDKSIYFTMLSYTDLELKVKDLYSH